MPRPVKRTGNQARAGWRHALVWAGCLLAVALGLTLGTKSAIAQLATPPRLVVVISVDQFGADLFARYRQTFSGGLAELAREGVVYSAAYQSHAVTETCPGHSTLLTGAHPNRTGITGNYWFANGKETYCLASTDNRLAHDALAEGRGPERLMTTTLGDWMKAATTGGKVVAIAGKDRAALTMGGHRSNGVFWYDDAYRGFTTYVSPGGNPAVRMAPIDPVNARLRAQFARNVPDWQYRDRSCRALEGKVRLGSTEWSPTVPPAGWTLSATVPAVAARSFRASPFLDLATLDAATALIAEYQLGADETPDLLTVGLSATDAIGHTYGAGGPEMCDHLGRLDAALGNFLTVVHKAAPDALVVLTADHGGSDLPERLAQHGYDAAKRIDSPAFLRSLNDAVAGQMKLPFAPFVVTERGYIIDQLYLAEPAGAAWRRGQRDRAVKAALVWLRARSEVAAAHARDELLRPPAPVQHWPEALTLRERMAESAYPGRSGDIMVVYRPLTTIVPALPGAIVAGHGSPWDYDRRVPLIFHARGMAAAARPLAVETVDIAPTLAAIMQVPVPAEPLDGRCLMLSPATGCEKTR